MIPIKFAERDEKPGTGYSYSAGESCPKKVFAPQRYEMRRNHSSSIITKKWLARKAGKWEFVKQGRCYKKKKILAYTNNTKETVFIMKGAVLYTVVFLGIIAIWS